MPKVTLPDGTVLVGGKAEEYQRAQKKEGGAAAASKHQSNADAFQADVLANIKATHKHGYRFYRVSRPAAWTGEDKERISNYILCQLRFHEAKDGPSSKEIHLFVGDTSYRFNNNGTIETATKLDEVLEVHPSLLKKNGKMAIDIPEGSVVAVRFESNIAPRMTRIKAQGSTFSTMGMKNQTVYHSYICAVTPPELMAHNTDDSRL